MKIAAQIPMDPVVYRSMLSLLEQLAQFQIRPSLSADDLQKMACGDQFIARNDRAFIGYSGPPIFRDNAHALLTLVEEARLIIAKAENIQGVERDKSAD
jgi:hypothetical protein